MKIEEYAALTESIDKGEVRAVYKALKFSANVLENIGNQLPQDVRREEVEQALYLTWRLCDVVMFHTMPASYWRGPEQQERNTPVEDDLDIITRSSYEQHWQDKGKSFHDEIANSIGEFKKLEDIANEVREREAGDEVKGIEEGIQKAKQERAILECKAAAFDEIAGEMASVYQAVHALDGSFDSDNDRNNVPYATMRAMFSLGIVAEIISKTKEDVVNAE